MATLLQRSIALRARPRGIHLVTDEITAALPEMGSCSAGVLHLLLQHTSASLSLGENADPDVRVDLERWLDRAAPEGGSLYAHDAEGTDDMPAHIKSAMLGVTLTIPVSGGRLAMGTWQGIYLGEYRDRGGARTVVATLLGA